MYICVCLYMLICDIYCVLYIYIYAYTCILCIFYKHKTHPLYFLVFHVSPFKGTIYSGLVSNCPRFSLSPFVHMNYFYLYYFLKFPLQNREGVGEGPELQGGFGEGPAPPRRPPSEKNPFGGTIRNEPTVRSNFNSR